MLSLCMIIKNEIANIRGLLEDVLSVVPEIHITDTGSTDGTLEVLNEAAKLHQHLHIHHFDWVDDFAAARNYSFSFATQPFILWLDGDDRVNSQDLRMFIDTELKRHDVDAWIMDYHYAWLPDGSPSITLGRERVLRRSCNPIWVGAIHETIGIWNMRTTNYSGLKIQHNRVNKKIDYGRNVRILKKEYEKNPKDARTAYYLGKELFDSCDDSGIQILENYLTLPGRWFDDEVNARFRLGKHYLSKKKHRETVVQAEQIYHLDSTRGRAEAYWLWGMVEKDLRNYRVAIEWFERCIRGLPPSPRVLGLEYYTWNPCWRIAECYKELQDANQSISWAHKAKKYLQQDPNLTKFIASMLPKPINGLTVGEFGQRVRSDSFSLDSFNQDGVLCLPDNYMDGAVISTSGLNINEIGRVIRPGGFLWINIPDKTVPEGFQSLPSANFNGHMVLNCIKVKPDLPTIAVGHNWENNEDYGPHRLRIINLIRSFIKNGHRIVPEGGEIGIGLQHHTKFKVMDICEDVPMDTSYADVIMAASDVLAHKLRQKTNKPVWVLQDHAEYAPEDWL